MSARSPGLLTLEPLIDAVRSGVEAAGWTLSGMQKTTSHEFEGRWEGESSRSAYLFFHPPDESDPVSVDVFLDETTRGLTGNLALVLDGPALGELGDVGAAIGALSRISERSLDPAYQTPLTLRLRLGRRSVDPRDAETEIRFKVRIPRRAIDDGAEAVAELAHAAVEAFAALLADPELERFAVRG